MINEEMKEMWKNFEKRVCEYEEKIRKKLLSKEEYNSLQPFEIDEKVRLSVNRKFQHESEAILGRHVYEVLVGDNGLWVSINASK